MSKLVQGVNADIDPPFPSIVYPCIQTSDNAIRTEIDNASNGITIGNTHNIGQSSMNLCVDG